MIIDGKKIAEEVKAAVAAKVQELGHVGLAVVLVGNNPASQTYVRNKERACLATGIESFVQRLPEETTTEDLLHLIGQLERNPKVNGILVQLPLPKHIDTEKVIAAIPPEKDVDCFLPVNLGKVVTGQAELLPCTPAGIMRLLGDVTGKHCVIVGRSNIVGKPLASMLLNADATVTVCHSKTKDLWQHTHSADVLIVAVGKPKFIGAHMVKDGAIIIDVGINRDETGKLVGDVDFDEVTAIKDCAITPVPGGVGPMTVAMLLENTVKAKEVQECLKHSERPS